MPRFILSLVLIVPLLILFYPFSALQMWWRVALAMLVLVIGLLLCRKGGDLSPKNESDSSYHWIDISLLVSLLVGLIFAATASITQLTKLEFFSSRHFGERKDSQLGYELSENGNWLWEDSLSRDLPKRSDHTPSDRTEVLIEFDVSTDLDKIEKTSLYVRGFSFGKFEAGRWSSVERFKRIGKSQELLGESLHNQNVDTLSYVVTLRKKTTGQNIVMSLQNALSIDYTQLTQISEGILLFPATDSDSYEYGAQSQPLYLDEIVQSDIHLKEGNRPEEYIQVNISDDLRRKVQGLLAGIDKKQSTYEKLMAVRSMLRERCTYSLKIDNSNDLESLDNFLFGEKIGYCEHFASAAALLSRELGIPSRMAYGYAGGTLYKNANVAVFRSKNAHAWAEVFIEGYGWVVFETTPENEETQSNTVEGDEAPPELDSNNKEESSVGEPPKGAPWSTIVFSMFGLLLVLGLLILLKQKRSELERNLRNSEKIKLPIYYEAFKQACMALHLQQVESKSVDQLLRELRDKGIGGSFYSELSLYHKRRFYQDAGEDKELENALLQKIEKWQDEISNKLQ